MKKRISFMLCLVLAALMLSMSGCESEEKQELLLGRWRCEIDLTEQLSRGLDPEGETAGYLKLDASLIPVEMEFREDDTFSMEVDMDRVEESLEQLMDGVVDGMSRYLEDMMYEQTGIETPAEEILASTGMTMEDLVDIMFPEETVVELKEQIVSEFTREGRFLTEEGRLYTSAGVDLDVDMEVYETYTLQAEKLTLVEYAGPGGTDNMLYPMEFSKIS